MWISLYFSYILFFNSFDLSADLSKYTLEISNKLDKWLDFSNEQRFKVKIYRASLNHKFAGDEIRMRHNVYVMSLATI